MDPFTLAQLFVAAQANPELLAGQLAAAGLAPPTLPISGGGNLVPTQAPAPPTPLLPVTPAVPAPNPQEPIPFDPTVYGQGGKVATDAAAAGPGGAGPLVQMLQAAGRNLPQTADTRPIMTGGISRAQPAPDAQAVRGAATTTSPAAIAQLLLNTTANPLRVPPLGVLMRGG
jgi:hypothetical protein